MGPRNCVLDWLPGGLICVVAAIWPLAIITLATCFVFVMLHSVHEDCGQRENVGLSDVICQRLLSPQCCVAETPDFDRYQHRP